ncbi:MAG: 50S ribosomal protein L37e [Candidatus Hodarchaeales archaeon]
MTKGTPSRGMRSGKKTHIRCRRCGNHSYHARKKRCAHCGYPSAKIRKYKWGRKTPNRHRRIR